LAPALASAVLALGLFAVTLGGTYIYDDFDVFQLDSRLRHPHLWWQYWTDSYNGGVDNLYRPLASMSYAIQWWLHGADSQIDQQDAWKYHLMNVLLHAAVSACVAELARRMAGTSAAWAAGLLFAAHPIHVEPVANIVGRAELMCALGVVGALVLFLKPLTTARTLGIAGCFLLALGSKEQGMLTPLLILLLWLCRLAPPSADGARRNRAGILLILLLTWPLAGYIVFRESILKFWWDRSFLDWTINPLVRTDADRWLMPLALLGRYFALLVAPLKLSPDYGATVIGWTVRRGDPYLWLGIAAIVAWALWLSIAVRRRDRAAIFCLIALALTYGLVSNFPILIGTNFAERLMYLPSVFFLVLAGMLLGGLPRSSLTALLIVLLVLFSWRTVTYAHRWNDRYRFYEISLREQPGSIRLYILRIAEEISRDDLDQAARLTEEACERLPDYWEVWIARADVAMRRGRFDEADGYLRRAMDCPPNPRHPTPRIVRWMDRLDQLRREASPATGPSG
jgi:hypothetical protein